MPKSELSERSQKALKLFEETTAYHGSFVTKARNRYRAYLGILERDSDAGSWQSKLAPPYVRNSVETQLAGLIAEKLSFQVKPRPRLYSPEEFEAAREGAKAHEILHNFQLKQDRFDEKQRDFVLQNLIVGFSVAKTSWRSDGRRKKRLKAVDIGLEEIGVPVGYYDLREVEEYVREYHGPCTEVVNIEDFFWHEAAVELQRSPILAHRVWMHFSELKEAERQGRYQNVDELKESRDQQGSDASIYEADSRSRTKDMIEVLEIWHREPNGIHVCTLGNRKVELTPCRPNPFWHGEYPFVAAATEPDLFQIPGLSQVGKTAHLQEAIWDFLNQTSDNARLMNNWILAVDPNQVEDAENLVRAPGEVWLVEGGGDINKAMQQFKPDPITAQLALPFIGMLQKDMQTLGGSNPFTSTSEAGRIGADTATEAALLTNLAQQSLKMQQRRMMMAYERIGQQRTELNQQFIRRELIVEQIGLDSPEENVRILPHLLQGDYAFDISPMAESLMRSERRAEANAFVQTAAQWFAVWFPAAQAGLASLPNIDAFTERYIEGYDEEPQKFMLPNPKKDQAQQQIAQGEAPPVPGMNGQQQPQAANGAGPGITAPQSIDPAVSPSAQASLSPEVHLQRLGAMSGGVSNT